MSYSITVLEDITTIDGDLVKLNTLVIRNDNKRIPVNSGIEFIVVTDGVTEVKSFKVRMSPDEKEFIGYFTTDGFSVFAGTVDVSFGFNDEAIGTINSVAINSIIEAIPATVLSSLTYQDADNSWLSNL